MFSIFTYVMKPVRDTVSLGYLWVNWLCLCDLAHFL